MNLKKLLSTKYPLLLLWVGEPVYIFSLPKNEVYTVTKCEMSADGEIEKTLYETSLDSCNCPAMTKYAEYNEYTKCKHMKMLTEDWYSVGIPLDLLDEQLHIAEEYGKLLFDYTPEVTCNTTGFSTKLVYTITIKLKTKLDNIERIVGRKKIGKYMIATYLKVDPKWQNQV